MISPSDLQKACSLFERLNLPFRLRKFESGLSVVQSDILLFAFILLFSLTYILYYIISFLIWSLLAHSDDQIAQRVLECIRSKGSLSAIELASMEQKSVVLVNEQLQVYYIIIDLSLIAILLKTFLIQTDGGGQRTHLQGWKCWRNSILW